MPGQNQQSLDQFGQQVSDYMPTLFGGLVVLAAGVFAGWILKRAVVRMLYLLRLDRLGGGRSAWRATMGKGDVRAAVYDFVGTIAGGVLLLVFLDNALQIWGLEVLARMVDHLIIYLPTLALALLIGGVGTAVSNVFAGRVEAVLIRERVPRTALLAGLAKAAFLTVVAALALWQLNFAREIVLSAFLIGFGAVGVAFALGVGMGSAKAIQEALSSVIKPRREE